MKWYRLGAEQGHLDSQVRLGLLYEGRNGVPPSGTLAYMWLNIAEAQLSVFRVWRERDAGGLTRGEFTSALGLAAGRVEQMMTPEQIAEGQRLAAERIEKEYKGCAR